MSLSQALSAAISGLKANQAGLALVSSNVANADTPGYVRKSITQVATAGNDTGISVNVTGVQRELDTYVQRQLRVENSGANYADTLSQMDTGPLRDRSQASQARSDNSGRGD